MKSFLRSFQGGEISNLHLKKMRKTRLKGTENVNFIGMFTSFWNGSRLKINLDRSSRLHDWRCSWKQTFLKISQYSQENTFNEVAGPKTCNFIKKRYQHRWFPAKFANIAKYLTTTLFTEHFLSLLLTWVPWEPWVPSIRNK